MPGRRPARAGSARAPLRELRSCAGQLCAGSGPARAPAGTGLALRGPGYGWSARRSPVREAVDGPVEKCLLRGTTWPSLWTFCGQRKNLEISARNPCATGVPGSRNTSLPETGTTPGATPERRKNRETGTSRGHPVPSSGRLTNRPPGNQRASGQRPGQAPASHTCRGLAYFAAGLFLRVRPISRPGPSPGPGYSLARAIPWPAYFRARPISRPGPIPATTGPSHGNVSGHPAVAKSAATATRAAPRPLARRVNSGRRPR
jgi:hypothetical protein